MTEPTGKGHGARAVVALALALGALVASMGGGQAEAAYPGDNGRLACEGVRSPDTTLSAVQRTEVFTIDPDGTDETVLTDNAVRDGDPAVSPDGSSVTFESFRAGSASEVFKMASDGTGVTQLTTNGPAEDRGTHWSPDGTLIAFHSIRDPLPPGAPAGSSPFEIYVMKANGTEQTRITTDTFQDTFPAWSPDGGRLAFTSTRSGDFEIWTMNPDGSDPLQLTNSPGEDAHATWSPDGTRLTFHSRRDGDLEIYRIDADGTNTVRLTNSPRSEFFPVWSPDGKRIAFNGDPDVAGNFDVYHVSAEDGSDPIRVTTAPGFDGRCDWLSIPRQTLAVVRAGEGSGTVTSTPPGIDCGADCAEAYAKDTPVTLAATAAAGSRFEGFSGSGCSGTSACTVVLDRALTVTATFSRIEQLPGPLPPAPTPVPAQAPPRVAPGLSARVSPNRDRRRPFRFSVSGRLTHPASVMPSDACNGRVTVRFRAGRKTLSSRRASLTSSCRYRRRVTFRSARRFGGRKRLRVEVTFEGNRVLLPARARPRSARVR